MTYEIPQQLQHKEKIMFGLTFSQLGWTFFFGIIDLIILKFNFSNASKFILAMFPTTLAILFMFFNFSRWIKDILKFMKIRSANRDSKKMKEIVNISKLKDSVIHSHKEVAILEITPINFSIKNKDAKEEIILSFQKFLNGLDFPIQFTVLTNELKLDKYYDKLEKKSKNSKIFQDFKIFLENNIANNRIRNRTFYVSIPKNTNLDIQCKICKERLTKLGLRVRRLDEMEMASIFYKFFNPETIVAKNTDRIPTMNFIDKIHKSINWIRKRIYSDNEKEPKDKESKNSPLHIIAPEFIKDNVNSFIVNNKYNRVISVVGYPRTVESGFLDKIISSNEDFDISIHIEPYPIDTMMVMLNNELQKQRADLFGEEQKKSINPVLEIKLNDTRKVLEALQKGQQKLFNISLYINCRGNTEEELNLLTDKVKAELNAIMVIPKVALYTQIPGYQSIIPIANNVLGINRNITTDALSAFIPFTSPFLDIQDDGVMLGVNKNGIPVIKDFHSLSNPNGIVLATSGAGKSFFTKLLIARQILNDIQVFIIDPQSEYIDLTKECKGELITISKDSATMINPLDLMGHDYLDKRLALIDMFKIMFGDLSEVQKSILDKAITKTYAKKQITTKSYKGKTPPVLKDLYNTLVAMDKKASSMEKVTYRALINRLHMYTHGVFSFVNKQTSIKFDKKFVCFNIGSMPKQIKPLIMFMILDYVYMKMQESKKQQKMLIIDEAWSLLSKAEEASYIFEIVKTSRKFNMGLLLITQDVKDLLDSSAGHAVLANSAYTFLMLQKSAVIDQVVRTFNLSQTEKEYLLNANRGTGILIMDNEHQELKVIASPKEIEIITTDPNHKKNKRDEVEEEPELAIDGLIYSDNDLTPELKNALYNDGFGYGEFVPIGKIRQEKFWIKLNGVESITHTFLVENIRKELLMKTKKVDVYVVNKPDILFINKKGIEIALEIETGKSFSKNKTKYIEKFSLLKNKYGKNCYIVLTDGKQRPNYERLRTGIKIITRKDIPKLIDQAFRRKK